MNDSLELLKRMMRTAGLSGYETPIREIIAEAWRPLTDELQVSRLGSLLGLQQGVAADPRPSILIATHMDAIGLMVTGIKAGLLHITEIGGIDARVLPGQLVSVHASEGELPGVIVQPPAHTLPEDERGGPVSLDYLLVDTGLTARQVARQVQVGDLVSFASEPLELEGGALAGHSLDNRASVAALTQSLEALKKRPHTWDLWAAATVNEEETMGGALTAAFELRPSIAIAIDVTHAKGPGTAGHESFSMNGGPVLGWGPNIHPKLHNEFKKAAERLEMSYQTEPLPAMSGTDAVMLQVAARGAATMVVSIPLRYMHTPVEMVHSKDVKRVARLLTEFVAELDEDFLDRLKWDDG